MNRQRSLADALQSQLDLLEQSWPEAHEWLIARQSKHAGQVNSSESSPSSREFRTIAEEERLALVNTLTSVAALPAGTLDDETAIRLARWLTYLIGKPVSLTLEGHSLMHHHGKIAARQGSSEWSVGVVPATAYQAGLTDLTSNWFYKQPVLLINPVSLQAVVGEIDSVMTSRLSRSQFAASPRLIRMGNFWSPGSNGKVVCCLLGEKIPPGSVINLLPQPATS